MSTLAPRRTHLKFGGWYDGDNHKPGRAWYVLCECGHAGLGQILPLSAWREYAKHARRCSAGQK